MASVVFYDSLELGDIVGVVKSNSLTVAMKILQHLYECPVVSDAYTYCGVDCCLLQNPTFLNISPNRLTPLESTTMTHATIFIHSFQCAQESCHRITPAIQRFAE